MSKIIVEESAHDVFQFNKTLVTSLDDMFAYFKPVNGYRISVSPPIRPNDNTVIYVWKTTKLVDSVRLLHRNLQAIVAELRTIEARILLGGYDVDEH